MVTQATAINRTSGSSFNRVVPALMGPGCGHVTFFGQWESPLQAMFAWAPWALRYRCVSPGSPGSGKADGEGPPEQRGRLMGKDLESKDVGTERSLGNWNTWITASCCSMNKDSRGLTFGASPSRVYCWNPLIETPGFKPDSRQTNQQRWRCDFEGLELRNGDPICNRMVWAGRGHTGYLKPDFHPLVTLLWGSSSGFSTNSLALLLGNAGCPRQFGDKVCRESSTEFSFQVVCGICHLQPILLLSGMTEPTQVLSE